LNILSKNNCQNPCSQTHGYIALLGSDDQSWGWNLVDNHLLHNGDSQGNYPMLNNAPKYQVIESNQ
jgi:F-box protein 45